MMIMTVASLGTVQAQGFGIKYLGFTRNDAGLSYNFFVGDDADQFTTTIDGFGSGFLFDVYTGRYSVDLLSLGGSAVNISLGLGVALTKYRFSENLLFTLDPGGQTVVTPDPDPEHEYSNTFFGYGKSKMVYGSVFLPLNLNLNLGPLLVSGGIMIDQYLSGKYKMKYIVDGEKQKEVIRNKDWRDYNLNKTKWGVNGLIAHRPSGIGVGFTYMLTPFFTENDGPMIN